MSVHILLVSAGMKDYASAVCADQLKAPHRAGVLRKLVLSREPLLSFTFLGYTGATFWKEKEK